MKNNKNVEIIIRKLKEKGYEAYLVGGVVRDFLLNRSINDYDVTTNAKPDIIIEIFSEYQIITNGLKHGTVSIIVNGEIIEVTTFRKESNYTDHRRPDYVSFVESLYEDLSRRDFTINAMAYDYDVIDYFNGIEDLKNRIIRTVGIPDDRFTEDALRILRALRFSSTLGFKIEEETKKSILKNYHLIKNISKERKTSEMMKMIVGSDFYDVFNEFYEVFNYLYCLDYKKEELNKIFDATQKNDIQNVELRFSILFYYHHSLKEILKENKFSKKMISEIDSIISISKANLDSKIDLLFALREKDYQIVYYGIILKGLFDSEYNVSEKLSLLGESKNYCYKISDLKLSGNDFLVLGVEKKVIGEVLNKLLDEVILNKTLNEKNELLKRGMMIIYEKRNII